MRFYSGVGLAALSAILPLTLANFDIYADSYRDWTMNYDVPAFRIFGGVESGKDLCKYLDQPAVRWPSRGDVSGGKWGIRCEGAGCAVDGDAHAIDVFEMSFSKTQHWTLYKQDPRGKPARDGGFWMYPADRDTQGGGYCFPLEDDEYACDNHVQGGAGAGQLELAKGRRKFRCMTDVAADDINSEQLQKMGDVYPYP
ncbi:hypothetical protein BU23DRAFT_661968 [Bimuria novae-zelandiae CBS 107.79]|uniref:Uncharacterized protein n=1 Tax=Bimuria novae-zelandiae CBS 107.79 TaxID=1447943 RepID=A0A6A5UMP5_9PLEO|nr:hypothetical protein BU23DRAFT_661968 [Bimuria novae-zelandiae CBS 107.79]